MRQRWLYTLLVVLLVALFVLDLCAGSVFLSLKNLFVAEDVVRHQIMLNLRLPKALVAVLAGVSLSASGLMMQTLFRNPLAGPYVLGVSSGATLGVAFVVLAGTLIGMTASVWMTVCAAVIGAMLVLLCVLAVSWRIESNVSLLIVGMMLGSIAGALVNVMQTYANPDSLKLFIVWTLGSLGAVGWTEMAILFPIFICGLVLTICLVKPLNGLLLGENYARGLGINTPLIRLLLVMATGCLAGGITAFCGPIAFVGVAVPHAARGLFRTANHRVTLSACALLGADLLLLCDIISNLFTYPLPISTVSALFGAPVVIHIILKK